MKEISDILKAYRHAENQQIRSALATVVKVEGSSYRRPGARMLVTEDGMLTGAISGGCLEGDALKKALSAIHQQENKLVTYDTTDEDDAKFGVQLGCNGIVHILFEPIDVSSELNPIRFLQLLAERSPAVLVTLFSSFQKQHFGTSLIYKKNELHSKVPSGMGEKIIADAENAFNDQTSQFKNYVLGTEQIEAFIEFLQPPVSLVIAGAGNDAQPLAEMAYLLGWNVTIADGRPMHATVNRFPHANQVLTAKPSQLLPQIKTDEQTAFVLMTHNYNYDIELLNLLFDTKAAYIGTLGPRKKLIRMLDELGRNTIENASRIYGPVGLDIGAETAEEIAISILAEIKTVFAGATASSLKEKKVPIHHHANNSN